MPAPEDDPFEAAEPSHSLRRPIDGPSLFDFQAAFERLEPMAEGKVDDPVSPTTLTLTLTDGVGSATSARLDVRRTTADDYSVHYTDSADRNCRWDVHPHDFPRPPDDTHFHPPPDASSARDDVEESCIDVSEVVLVARAVHRLWRLAYDQGGFEGINAVENPP